MNVISIIKMIDRVFLIILFKLKSLDYCIL